MIVGRRARGAHEALPHTPPGDKPPETPGPLSLGIYVPERKESVKGSQAAQKPRALDRFLPFRRAAGMRERGPLGGGSSPPHHATKDYGPLKPKTSCRGDLRRGTTTSGPGRGPMAGFEVPGVHHPAAALPASGRQVVGRRIDLLPNVQASDMSGDLCRVGRHLFSGAYGNNSFHEASPELVSKSQEK